MYKYYSFLEKPNITSWNRQNDFNWMKKVNLSAEALYSAQLKDCLILKVQDLNTSYSWWGKKADFVTHIM